MLATNIGYFAKVEDDNGIVDGVSTEAWWRVEIYATTIALTFSHFAVTLFWQHQLSLSII